MNILVISHSSVVGMYQGKLNELSKYPNVNVSLIVPPKWVEGGRLVNAETTRYSTFKTYIVHAYRVGYIASYFFNPVPLWSLVKKLSPDIIYLEEEPWSVVAWQIVSMAKKINAKILFFTWENVWRKYKWISERILNYVLCNADAAVAGNKDAEIILRRRGFKKPIAVIPQYGIDEEVFQKRNNVPSEIVSLDKPVIGYIGRLEYEKGVHILLEAVAKIQKSCSVVVIGNGTYKKYLVSLSKKLNIDEKVHFMNAVPNEEIPNYLSGIDILVLPSLTTPTWKEQFGRVLVEAMACGVPVIGSDSGAIPEVIGDAGLIFREGDVEDLVKKLNQFIKTNTLRFQILPKASERSQDLFSNVVISHNLHAFIKNIIPR